MFVEHVLRYPARGSIGREACCRSVQTSKSDEASAASINAADAIRVPSLCADIFYRIRQATDDFVRADFRLTDDVTTELEADGETIGVDVRLLGPGLLARP